MNLGENCGAAQHHHY